MRSSFTRNHRLHSGFLLSEKEKHSVTPFSVRQDYLGQTFIYIFFIIGLSFLSFFHEQPKSYPHKLDMKRVLLVGLRCTRPERFRGNDSPRRWLRSRGQNIEEGTHHDSTDSR